MLHHIYNTTGLYRKILYIALNVCDLKGVLSFIDIYATQVSNLSADCLFIDVWSLLLLSTTVGNEFEKLVGRN